MKHYGPVRGVVLTLLGSFGAGVILRWASNFPSVDIWAFVLAGTLGGFAGALSNRLEGWKYYGLLGLGLAAGLAPTVQLFGGFLMPIFAGILYMLSFGALFTSGYGFYGPLGVWSTVLTGLSVLAAENELGVYAGVAALLCLVLTMDGFRDSSVRKSQHRKRQGKYVDNPGMMIQHSYVLMAVFLTGALLLGGLTLGLSGRIVNLVKTATTEGTHGIGAALNWLFWLIEAILRWFSSLFPKIEDRGGGIVEENTVEKPVYTGGEGSLLATLIMVLCFVGACIALCFVCGHLMRRGKRRIQEGQSADFEDEVEALERPRFRRPLRRGRQSYRRIQDPSLKIRYVFQQLLRQRVKQDGGALCKTPNELLNREKPDEETLIGAYNRVRYAGGAVSTAELEAAERYLKQL